MSILRISCIACCTFVLANGGTGAPQQMPKAWDDAALVAFEVPLANRAYSPVHVSSADYYLLPTRPIYKSYPIYAPGRQPEGYIEWLEQQDPEIVFDPAMLQTEADWIRAGELVFNAPISYRAMTLSATSTSEYWRGMPTARDGTLPFQQYVIRKKGVIEVGDAACGKCHTRVLPDGSVLKGAQGNFPDGRVTSVALRRRAAADNDQGLNQLAVNRTGERVNSGAPWIQPDPGAEYVSSFDELVASWAALIPGVATRGAGRRYPPQIPDLIGVKERHYLDHTGLVRNRTIGDLMRYAALNQDTQILARYGDFKPAELRPPNSPIGRSRYSDEQLYALALYLYSLKPPPNPNAFDDVAARGQKVFQREGCAACHTPPLYTNNKLTLAEGFNPPERDRAEFDVMPVSVGTDPHLALSTRRGTGYYKVPSLAGVWYRGPFEHNGSVATLEDWFDARRLRDDYVPTGFKPFGVTTRAVKGHEFGLKLTPEERRALIAFLRTL